MKKKFLSVTASLLLLTMLTLPAGAVSVDVTDPDAMLPVDIKALPGARFLVQNANGTFEKEVVTGSDGTVTLTNLEASTYSVTELEPPEDYQIDNAGPQYVVLPNSNGETVVVTFTDTPVITSEGSIRKVDADDPTKGLAGAVIKIEGVDNEFVGTYTTGAGGYLEDVPWDSVPIGSFVATEVRISLWHNKYAKEAPAGERFSPHEESRKIIWSSSKTTFLSKRFETGSLRPPMVVI